MKQKRLIKPKNSVVDFVLDSANKLQNQLYGEQIFLIDKLRESPLIEQYNKNKEYVLGVVMQLLHKTKCQFRVWKDHCGDNFPRGLKNYPVLEMINGITRPSVLQFLEDNFKLSMPPPRGTISVVDEYLLEEDHSDYSQYWGTRRVEQTSLLLWFLLSISEKGRLIPLGSTIKKYGKLHSVFSATLSSFEYSNLMLHDRSKVLYTDMLYWLPDWWLDTGNKICFYFFQGGGFLGRESWPDTLPYEEPNLGMSSVNFSLYAKNKSWQCMNGIEYNKMVIDGIEYAQRGAMILPLQSSEIGDVLVSISHSGQKSRKSGIFIKFASEEGKNSKCWILTTHFNLNLGDFSPKSPCGLVLEQVSSNDYRLYRELFVPECGKLGDEEIMDDGYYASEEQGCRLC